MNSFSGSPILWPSGIGQRSSLVAVEQDKVALVMRRLPPIDQRQGHEPYQVGISLDGLLDGVITGGAKSVRKSPLITSCSGTPITLVKPVASASGMSVYRPWIGSGDLYIVVAIASK